MCICDGLDPGEFELHNIMQIMQKGHDGGGGSRKSGENEEDYSDGDQHLKLSRC